MYIYFSVIIFHDINCYIVLPVCRLVPGLETLRPLQLGLLLVEGHVGLGPLLDSS